MEEDKEISSEKTQNIISNIVTAIDGVLKLKDGIHAAVLNEVSEDGSSSRKESCELATEVKNLRLALSDLHLKHKTHARELQSCRDTSAKNKAELKRLKGELESAVSELEESNSRLATLKAERDATKGAFFPVINVGNKPVAGDKTRDKQKNLQEMESALRELQDQTSSQLLELKRLHDERIKILQQLSHLQNSFKNVMCISSSHVYMLVRDQLEKSKVEVHQYQALYEKLQVERDNLVWREKELSIKSDLVDVSRRSSAVVDSRIADLETEIQSQMNERNIIESKLEEASREPGRKEIIAEFKALLSSFPDEMGNMQRQLSNYNEASSDIHTLQADVRSLSTVLDRKVKECESLSSRSKDKAAEIERLQSLVQDLKESDLELKLILEMYRRESTDSRDAFGLSDVLKSKTEENEAYLSEIESIGQAYDGMQTQNQHLLQQITERDDYNVKLMLEGVKARQLEDSLLMDKQTMERKVQQANTSLDFFNAKDARIEDQKRISMGDTGSPNTSVTENTPLIAHDEDLRNQSLIPQILTSMPSLDDATSYFAETTLLLTRCFTDFSVEHSSRDTGNPATHAQELVTFSNNGYRTSNRSQSTFSDPSTSAADSPPVHDEMIRKSSEGPAQNSSAIVPSTHPGQNGISLFQRLIDRAQRTVRGSADDIGWMQRDPEMPPVEDGTERFMGILDNIRHGLHKLPNSMVYLLVPGLFSNHGPLYFITAKAYFSKLGLACHIAKIHSEASVEKNAREIKEYIEEICWGSQKRVMLLGHSKGGIDAAAALSLYWPELKDKVAGLALAQSPYGGSPIASDILREGQLGDYVNVRKLMEIIICKVLKGDLQALEDLTYEKRKEFLGKHHLPRKLPVVSLRTETATSVAVLATLSRVAHAEVPMVGELAKLPVVMPLGAAMAACAQLLQVRYGEKSDGLVTCRDAEVPGSVVVRPPRKLDHAWMVYSSLNDDPSEADASQVCEALLTLVLEEGQRKKYQLSMKNE